mgnify:CR=1 FL=1
MQWCLSLADCFLGNGCFLSIKLIELLHAHLIIIIFVRLLSRLEGLYLIDGLVSIFIYPINCFDHSVQVPTLDSKLFLQLQVDLFKDNSFATHLIDLLPDRLLLSHGIAGALVCLIEAILDNLGLLAELCCSVLV